MCCTSRGAGWYSHCKVAKVPLPVDYQALWASWAAVAACVCIAAVASSVVLAVLNPEPAAVQDV